MTVARINTFTKHVRSDPRYQCRMLEQIIQDPDEAIRSCGSIMKHDDTTTVAIVEERQLRWVIKRYNTKSLWHAVRRIARRSRAVNSWDMSGQLREASISTPARIAYIENRFGPLRGRSYFINEFIEADDVLTTIEKEERSGTRSTELLMVALFEKLHESGIYHGDMKSTNILVSSGDIVLLDFDAAGKARSPDGFDRAYGKDRARFLRNWGDDTSLHSRFDSTLPR